MKFAVGFVVGAVIGRPVLSAISRRINLTERVQKKTADIIYTSTLKLQEKVERVLFGDEAVEASREARKNYRYTREYKR